MSKEAGASFTGKTVTTPGNTHLGYQGPRGSLGTPPTGNGSGGNGSGGNGAGNSSGGGSTKK